MCPLVTRVHNEAKKYHREGKKVLLVGHRGHQEVRGTMGQVPMTLIDDSSSGVARLGGRYAVAVLTQTTLSVGRHGPGHRQYYPEFPQRHGTHRHRVTPPPTARRR